MLNLFTKKGAILTLKIEDMHCTSCAMSIDNTLEDLEGVYSSKTNYAKSITIIRYEPNLLTSNFILNSISKLGYRANVLHD